MAKRMRSVEADVLMSFFLNANLNNASYLQQVFVSSVKRVRVSFVTLALYMHTLVYRPLLEIFKIPLS